MGLVVGGASLTVASLVTEQPAGNTPPSAPQVSVPVSPEANLEVPAAQVAVDATIDAPQIEVAEAPRAVESMVEVVQPMMDTSSADVPEATAMVGVMDAPEAAESPAEIAGTVEEPVLPSPQALAPQAPATEQDLMIATAPAFIPEGDMRVIANSESDNSSQVTSMPQDEMVLPEPIDEVVPETAPVDPSLDVAGDAATSSLPGGNSGVKVNRIVSIKPELEVQVEDELTAAQDPALNALEQYGTPFENPEGKPLMGVIVLDDGTMNDAAILLKSIPVPMTVVLDPSVPDVVQRMSDYRNAGIEIGVLSALPAGADPADVAPSVTMEWERKQEIGTIEICFDTDFDHPMESVLMGHPENVMPFCVTSFSVEDENGNMLWRVQDNHQTIRRFKPAEKITAQKLTFRFEHPSENVPAAVFAIRCFND